MFQPRHTKCKIDRRQPRLSHSNLFQSAERRSSQAAAGQLIFTPQGWISSSWSNNRTRTHWGVRQLVSLFCPLSVITNTGENIISLFSLMKNTGIGQLSQALLSWSRHCCCATVHCSVFTAQIKES